MSDVTQIRSQFPILGRKVNGQPLVYFDNAATTQKPERVIGAMSGFYRNANANIHRGVHTLSREATDLYEAARRTVAAHFSVKDEQQVIFTAGATDGINLVAQGLSKKHLAAGDEIIVSTYEHHSNILPWQLWAEEHGGILKEIPLAANQSLEYGKIESLISARTRLIAIAHVSNTLGLVSDVERIMKLARQHGIPVMIDGAQSAPHMRVDLGALDPDFFVCSAHKIYGPTGTGMLYMSAKWMKELPLSRSGGGTIKSVTFAGTEYEEGAMKFEPGTPNVAGAIGFAEALRFVADVGIDAIAAHEHDLVQYAQDLLEHIPGLTVYGSDKAKAAVISFNVKDQHPFDVGTLLDKYGIAVRTGHHCTQPLMQCLGVQGTVRISFAVYNTKPEIDFFAEKLKKVIKLLG